MPEPGGDARVVSKSAPAKHYGRPDGAGLCTPRWSRLPHFVSLPAAFRIGSIPVSRRRHSTTLRRSARFPAEARRHSGIRASRSSWPRRWQVSCPGQGVRSATGRSSRRGRAGSGTGKNPERPGSGASVSYCKIKCCSICRVTRCPHEPIRGTSGFPGVQHVRLCMMV